VRIILVDDHEIVRKGIRQILEDRWEICGEAANGTEALEKAIMNGVEATRKIREVGLPTKIVFLSARLGDT
jgi:DNA-binding NarL/FixJ family response regulator